MEFHQPISSLKIDHIHSTTNSEITNPEIHTQSDCFGQKKKKNQG